MVYDIRNMEGHIMPYVPAVAGAVSNATNANNNWIAGINSPGGIGYLSSFYYASEHYGRGTSSGTGNQPLLTPIHINTAGYFNRIAVMCVTGGASTMRLGIYNSDGLPSTLVLDAGSVTLNTSASFNTITINQYLEVGTYWLCGVVQTNTNSTFVSTVRSTTGGGYPFMPQSATYSALLPAPDVYSATSVTGALPSTLSTTLGIEPTNRAPIIFLRRA